MGVRRILQEFADWMNLVGPARQKDLSEDPILPSTEIAGDNRPNDLYRSAVVSKPSIVRLY